VRLLNWLRRDVLGLHGTGITAINVPWLSYVVLGLIAGVLVAVGALAVRNGSWRRLLPPAVPPGVVVTEAGEAMSPVQWRREAERLVSEGRYREALRCRYRALVSELAERRVVEEVPGRTSGDYERLVSALVPEVAAQFSALTRSFERCWYGREPADASGQASFEAMAEAVLSRLGSTVSRAPSRRSPSDMTPSPTGGR
jgi:hypothetical protein